VTVDPLTTGLLVVVALLAGTIDAVAGGGGLITLPALTLAGLPLDIALATNKGQSTFGSFASSAAFWRAGKVDRKQALFAFPLAAGGSVLGASLQMQLSRDALRPVVMVLLLVAAAVLIIKKPTREDDDARGRPWIAAALAFGIGGYDGFFGPGTGTFLVVGFVALCGRSLVRATADAKVVNFAANIAALVTFARAGSVVWAISLPMAAGQLVGGVVGARLALRGGAKFVRFAVVVITCALVVRLASQMW
jgi:hypothetical protein